MAKQEQERNVVRTFETPEEAKEIHKVVTTIGGNEYTIRGEESEEHLLGIAAMVDNKMMELKQKYPRQTNARIAILAALQLADEYVKLSDQYDKILQELDDLAQK